MTFATLTPAEHTLIARQGIYTRLATEDPEEMTRPARRGWMARFDAMVVEQFGELPSWEHARRAHAFMCAYMAELSRKSARARGAKSRTKRGGNRAA